MVVFEKQDKGKRLKDKGQELTVGRGSGRIKNSWQSQMAVKKTF